MNAQIELTSIAMSKQDPKISKLDKYDIDANIEEIDNADEQSVFKYGFTALSSPKNVRLALEGIARISGDAIERNNLLEKDENNVPRILTLIYHELFPTFFLLSKTLNVSCPPHVIGELEHLPADSEAETSEESVEKTFVDDSSQHISESTSSEPPDSETKTPDIVQPTV